MWLLSLSKDSSRFNSKNSVSPCITSRLLDGSTGASWSGAKALEMCISWNLVLLTGSVKYITYLVVVVGSASKNACLIRRHAIFTGCQMMRIKSERSKFKTYMTRSAEARRCRPGPFDSIAIQRICCGRMTMFERESAHYLSNRVPGWWNWSSVSVTERLAARRVCRMTMLESDWIRALPFRVPGWWNWSSVSVTGRLAARLKIPIVASRGEKTLLD